MERFRKNSFLFLLVFIAAWTVTGFFAVGTTKGNAPTYAVQVFDGNGRYLSDVSPAVSLEPSGNLHISFPSKSQFRPGLYYVRVYIVSGTKVYVSTGSFRWGVLALNFDKTVYRTGNTANIGFGVLDDMGRTVCGATAQLTVTNPAGGTSVYTTQNGSIQKSPVCAANSVTNFPDYSVAYKPVSPGTYRVHLTADTTSGTRTDDDAFTVESNPLFDVQRGAPTRIYPPVKYRVNIVIVSSQDFSGTITETAPSSFYISQQGMGEDEVPLEVTPSQILSQNLGGQAASSTATSVPTSTAEVADTQTITWHVTFPRGEKHALWYVFKAPEVSPQFYLTGPAKFAPADAASTPWQETRRWQIAADACGFGAAIGGGKCQGAIISTASTTWTVPSDWNNTSNTIEVVGAGGGGNSGGGTGGVGGAGGGGGAYAEISNFSTSTGNSINIQVATATASSSLGFPGQNGTSTWFNGTNCSTASVCGAGGSGGGSGGSTASSTGTIKNAGGNGGNSNSTLDSGGGGGGGGAGPNGVGAAGASSGSTAGSGGGGGGGNGGGSTASSSVGTTGGGGGNNFSGSGGGAGGVGAAGGVGSNGGGGGGGGGTTGSGGGKQGGAGSQGTEWSSASPSAGSGGGGGAGGGDSRTSGSANSNGGGAGAGGGNYGGGGGGGGGCAESLCPAGTGGSGGQGVIVITYNFAYSSTTETRYRWRNDNGSESGASWQAAENTAGTATSTKNVYRIRLEAANSGNSSTSKNFQLQYQATATSGAWTTVPSTSTLTTQLFVMSTSTQATLATAAAIANGTSTTPQLTADAASSTNGFLQQATSSSGVITLLSTSATTTYTEVEYAIQVTTSTTSASNGTFFFRVTDAGVALDNYTQWAKLTLKLNTPPNRPILNTPAPNATGSFASIVFKMTATDPNADNIQYKQTIYNNEACTQVVQTNDETASQTGWSGQNSSSSAEYTSGNTGVFTLQTSLATGTYYWGASTIDPEGTNTFGSSSLTIVAPNWTTNANALLSNLENHSALVYNGYIYTVGGDLNGSASVTTTVSFAPINSNGTVGKWATTTPLLSAIENESAVVYNGNIYTTGGFINGNVTSTVFSAPINSNGTVGTWQTNSNSLPSALGFHSSAAYNGYLYVTGGSITNTTSTVFYAPINSNGTVGSWATTAALPSTLDRHSAIAYNGYLYTIGGESSANANTTSTVFYAPINSNGTVGSWATTMPLPSVNRNFSTVVYNGYLYTTGGLDSAVTSTVFYAPINSNGTVGTWATTMPLPSAIGDESVVVSNGYLYTTGGAPSAGTTSTVFYAQINQKGTTDSANGWQNQTKLPSTMQQLSAATYNGYLYTIGGSLDGSASGITSTVYFASVSASGTVGSFATTTPLPAALNSLGTAIWGNKLYAIGGQDPTVTATKTVTYATFNANGTLSNWTSTASLPSPLVFLSAVAYNGYLYTTGGSTSTVFQAKINPDGTLAAWGVASNSLPSSISQNAMAVNNGYLYSMGGTSGGATTSVFYAPVHTDGSVGAWKNSAPLPGARMNLGTVVYNGFLYSAGGWNGTNNTSSVLYSQILPLATGSGTISSWIGGTSLPQAVDQHGTVVVNGYLYVIGGEDPSLTTTSTVQSIGLWTSCTAFTATSSAPVVSSVILNHNNALVLTPNATTSFDINYTITENDGCAYIQQTTSTAFRTGVASTCATGNPTTSNQNCYVRVTNTTSSCISSTQLNGTSTVALYYFADSTGVASSSYPSQHWEAYVSAGTSAGLSSSATSSDVDVNVMTALNLSTSTINYGTLTGGQNTGSTNQSSSAINVGNSWINLQLSGNAFTAGSNSISTSSQHYATSTFTYGGAEQTVSSIAVNVPGFQVESPYSTATLSNPVYFGMGIPVSAVAGSYQSTVTYTAVFAAALPPLAGLWPFDEGVGTTTTDYSGNGYTGLLSTSTAPTWKTSGCIISNCLTFDGSSTFVDAGIINLSTSSITLAAWVNPTAFQNASPFISSILGEEKSAADIALLRLGDIGLANNVAQFVLDGPSQTKLNGNTAFATSTWTFVAGTYDGTTMRLYVNGVLDSSISSTGTIIADYDFKIASSPDFGRYFNGSIDQARVYTQALTANQVLALYQAEQHH